MASDPPRDTSGPVGAAEQLRHYLEVAAPLAEWIAGTQALAVLEAATTSGLLDAAREPVTPEALAAVTGRDPERVRLLCVALDAHGVFERDGSCYRLSEFGRTLADPGAPLALSARLTGTRATVRRLARVVDVDPTRPVAAPPDALALMQSVGVSPLSPLSRATVDYLRQVLPELAERWADTARHLELGCGVGNDLLTVVTGFPRVTAVGVEIDPPTAAEARRRAHGLGVADRVEVRCTDAADLVEEAAFDTAQWSQAFFRQERRQDAVRALHRVLRPDGLLYVPVVEPPPEESEELHSRRGRLDAIRQLLLASWGVPRHSVDEATRELTDAGFQVLRHVPVPRGLHLSRTLVVARRP